MSNIPQDTAIRLLTPQLFSSQIQIPESSNVNQYINLLYEEFYRDNTSYNKRKICDSLYTIIFSKLEEIKQYQTFHIKQTDKLELFLKFKSYVELHFTDSRNADFYASKLNITYKHLNTICKEIVGVTAKTFIDEFIVLEAKRLLVNSSVKSSELAFQLGFNEQSAKSLIKKSLNLFKADIDFDDYKKILSII